jgi:hypothetical protein
MYAPDIRAGQVGAKRRLKGLLGVGDGVQCGVVEFGGNLQDKLSGTLAKTIGVPIHPGLDAIASMLH